MNGHKARVEAAFGGEKSGQAGKVVIDETFKASFAHLGQFVNGDRQIIQRLRRVLAVEIAPGDDLSSIGEHQWVVSTRFW